LNIFGLKAAPWDLDQETKDLFDSQINSSYQKHLDEAIAKGKNFLLVDFEDKILNFYDKTCSYCQDHKKSSQFNFEERLNQFNFKKKWLNQPKAHCFGTTLFFIQYILSKPQVMMHACADIFSEISNASDFEEKVHFFSMNQHTYYIFQDLEIPLELNPVAMKQYFKIILEKSPSDYFFLPLSADNAIIEQASIYATLKNLPDKLIIVGYSKENIEKSKIFCNHCIAISTHLEKLFVFDSNFGMYHFPNLETLSRDLGEILKNLRFRWLVAFPLKENI
jgi:hypothetical protein